MKQKINKLIKNIDNEMWLELRNIAYKKELSIADFIKMILEFYKKHSTKN